MLRGTSNANSFAVTARTVSGQATYKSTSVVHINHSNQRNSENIKCHKETSQAMTTDLYVRIMYWSYLHLLQHGSYFYIFATEAMMLIDFKGMSE